MKFIEKVGNIKVYTEKNADRDITVSFYNGSDLVLSEVFFTNNEHVAIETLFQKLDTYTEEWLWLNFLTEGLEKVDNDLYRLGENYFKRIDDTKYFKYFSYKPMVKGEKQ